MLYRNRSRNRRSAFTLIELLVVIAIIAILASLTAAAVMRVLGAGPRTQARTEISDLEKALGACQVKYGLDYIPSQLVLARDPTTYNLNNAVEKRSKDILFKMFGKQLFVPGQNIAWNGQPGAANAKYTLYGQQCLVFFAGGIPDPTNNACQGFSTNNANPAQAGGTRNGPWFDFNPGRLVRDNNGFFVYNDPYQGNAAKPVQPYAFFSSYAGVGYQTGDCTIPTTVWTQPAPTANPQYPQPYKLPTGGFLNPQGVQILCAGADGKWSKANTWTYDPKNGTTDADAQDNQANFAGGILAGPSS